MKKSLPEIEEQGGTEKKNIPKISERDSEASIPRNGRERKQEWKEKITMFRTDWKCCEMFENKGMIIRKCKQSSLQKYTYIREID